LEEVAHKTLLGEKVYAVIYALNFQEEQRLLNQNRRLLSTQVSYVDFKKQLITQLQMQQELEPKRM
jgi:hypothetical protein